jgi:broad specificity phosphatase PhoE
MPFWKRWQVVLPVCAIVLVFVWWSWCWPCHSPATIVLVVRHGEKAGTLPNDLLTPLSEDGEQRADELARVLGGSDVQQIYNTEFKRTRDTAEPLVMLTGAAQTELAHAQLADLISRIRSSDRGKTVVVVGHSDTVPEIVRQLSGGGAPVIGEQFDNLFEVILPRCGTARILRLKYGVPTP